MGKDLCKVAFIKVLGISEKRLRKVQHLHSSGVVTAVRASRLRTKSEMHKAATTWLKRYSIGDKMPHIQQIHLPHFLSKKVVYDIMQEELNEQGFCSADILSLSCFYLLYMGH